MGFSPSECVSTNVNLAESVKLCALITAWFGTIGESVEVDCATPTPLVSAVTPTVSRVASLFPKPWSSHTFPDGRYSEEYRNVVTPQTSTNGGGGGCAGGGLAGEGGRGGGALGSGPCGGFGGGSVGGDGGETGGGDSGGGGGN